jgi:hypothetical protein
MWRIAIAVSKSFASNEFAPKKRSFHRWNDLPNFESLTGGNDRRLSTLR